MVWRRGRDYSALRASPSGPPSLTLRRSLAPHLRCSRRTLLVKIEDSNPATFQVLNRIHGTSTRTIQSGGEGGIRTLDTFTRIHTFQACSFNRSDTSPKLYMTICYFWSRLRTSKPQSTRAPTLLRASGPAGPACGRSELLIHTILVFAQWARCASQICSGQKYRQFGQPLGHHTETKGASG